MGSVGRVCRPGSVDTVVGTRTEGRVRSSNQDGGKVRSEQDREVGGISSVDTVVGTRTEGRVRSSNQDGGKVKEIICSFNLLNIQSLLVIVGSN